MVRGAFRPAEMTRISQDSDEVSSEGRQGLPFAGKERQIVMGFIEKRPSLTAIVEDDRSTKQYSNSYLAHLSGSVRMAICTSQTRSGTRMLAPISRYGIKVAFSPSTRSGKRAAA